MKKNHVSNMKKVLFIHHGDDKYGSSKSLVEMILELKKNHEIKPIVITSRKNKLTEFLTLEGIENFSFEYTWAVYKKDKNPIKNLAKFIIKRFRYSIRNNKQLKKIEDNINFNEIDIIHTNTSVLDIGIRLSIRQKKQHIWHLREFGKQDFNLYPLSKQYIKYLKSSNNTFVAISNSVKDSWIKKGIDKNRINVIYNGVKVSSTKRTTHIKLDDTKIRMVFLGAITKEKGQEQLIDALNLLDSNVASKVSVDFIGDGKDHYIKYLLAKLKNDRQNIANFLGYKKNASKLLDQYDVGINCSKAEAFGRVSVEYMINGLCVIASNSGANVEIIGDSGLLYEYGDYVQLSNILETIIKKPNIIIQKSKNSIKNDFYTSAKNARMINSLYETVSLYNENKKKN